MLLAETGSTHPTLIKKVADWNDHVAWVRFWKSYQPLLRRWCRRYRLSDSEIDDVCQLIWIELQVRMKTFEYDPNRTFRGWLRRLCESRVLNFLERRRRDLLPSLDECDGQWTPFTLDAPIDLDDAADEIDDLPSRLLTREGVRVQAAVKARSNPKTWEAFWLVAICEWSVDRTARSLGMSKVAVFAARDRVAKKLAEEGKRSASGSGTGS